MKVSRSKLNELEKYLGKKRNEMTENLIAVDFYSYSEEFEEGRYEGKAYIGKDHKNCYDGGEDKFHECIDSNCKTYVCWSHEPHDLICPRCGSIQHDYFDKKVGEK